MDLAGESTISEDTEVEHMNPPRERKQGKVNLGKMAITFLKEKKSLLHWSPHLVAYKPRTFYGHLVDL